MIITKYSSAGQAVLEPGDDPATVYLGSEWRTPSAGEFQELIDNCEWQWLPMGAFRVTSKVPGYTDKSIMLYAAGYMEGKVLNGGERLCYWTRDLNVEDLPFAKALIYNGAGDPVVSVFGREKGCSIRPVKVK